MQSPNCRPRRAQALGHDIKKAIVDSVKLEAENQPGGSQVSGSQANGAPPPDGSMGSRQGRGRPLCSDQIKTLKRLSGQEMQGKLAGRRLAGKLPSRESSDAGVLHRGISGTSPWY